MVYLTVRQDYVEVVGHIWQPGVGLCATRMDLSDYDLRNIVADRVTGDVPVNDETLTERFTRESVADWLTAHSGDFSEVVDFYATAGHVEIPWASEDSEMAYIDAMYPAED